MAKCWSGALLRLYGRLRPTQMGIAGSRIWPPAASLNASSEFYEAPGFGFEVFSAETPFCSFTQA